MELRNGYDKTSDKPLSLKERYTLLTFVPLCVLAAIIGFVWMVVAILYGARGRSWRLVLSYDQVANAAFGGSEDETISSRAGKKRDQNVKWGCILCKLLDFLEKDHCTKAKETFISDLTSVSQTNVVKNSKGELITLVDGKEVPLLIFQDPT